MEYSYSVMERLSMAAMSQGDDKLQYPMINNLGNEVWKCKEAKQSVEEAPLLGDPEKRAILMEAVGAVAYVLCGSNILIMRHPESIRLVKAYIKALLAGGSVAEVAPIEKRLASVAVDFAALAPPLDLSIEEEKKGAVPVKKEAPAKKQAPAQAAAASAPPAAAAAPKKEAAAAKPAAPEVDSKAAAEAAAKEKAEAEVKAKADAEAKAKADAEAKVKAEQQAKAKAEAEAEAQKEAEKKAAADARAARDAEEKELRAKRAKERAELAAKRTAVPVVEGVITPAAIQKTEQQKILEMLDRFHKRV
ncbi:MAG: acetyl-CoA synthase, partial [Desulfofustis sp.]|nr:acetyl-CoA synthase [Desulfofustis sp.]